MPPSWGTYHTTHSQQVMELELESDFKAQLFKHYVIPIKVVNEVARNWGTRAGLLGAFCGCWNKTIHTRFYLEEVKFYQGLVTSHFHSSAYSCCQYVFLLSIYLESGFTPLYVHIHINSSFHSVSHFKSLSWKYHISLKIKTVLSKMR